MTDEVVLFERRGNVAICTLNRPEARNAVSPAVTQTMEKYLDEIEADPDLRVVVITGNGDVFCAGADLKVVASGGAADIARGKGGFAGVVTRNFPKPIIAACQGPALAGGFELMISCDCVVAADTAKFGIPEAKRGLLAAAGGLTRLPKRVSLAIALEMAMTGDPIDADRAYQLGLVNRVVPREQVLDEAIALAERIGENSPIAVRNSRKLAREANELTEEESWQRTLELMNEVFQTGDAVEGATAFAEKRKPVWKST
jgi:enoyl-CoA hydratase